MSTPVRLPRDLYVRAEALAEKERRSIANMIAVLVEEALDARRLPPNVRGAIQAVAREYD